MSATTKTAPERAAFPTGVGPNTFTGYLSGMIDTPAGGSYNFGTSSDDGTVLFVDGQLVVNNNNYQGFNTPFPDKTGSITLSAGYHNIVLGYFQGGGGYSFEAAIKGPSDTGYADLGATGTASSSAYPLIPDLVAPSALVTSTTGAADPGLLGFGNLTVGSDNGNSTFSGNLAYSNTGISAVAGLLKIGTGQLTVTGTATYGGATTVAAGVLALATPTTLPAGQINVVGGILSVQPGNGTTGWTVAQMNALVAAANWNGGAGDFGIDTTKGNYTYTGDLASIVAPAIGKTGPNALILTGASTFTGQMVVNSGTLQIGSGGSTGSIDSSSGVTLANNATLAFNRSDNLSFAVPVSATAAWRKTTPIRSASRPSIPTPVRPRSTPAR